METVIWFAQVTGIKRWQIRPPPECRRSEGLIGAAFGSYRNNVCDDKIITFTAEPGDVLVLDADRWEHATFLMTPSITISGDYLI